MKRVYSINIIFLSLICFCLGLYTTSYAQTADLRIVGQLNCTQHTYTATLQIRAADSNTFVIGTSSFFMTYNPSSISYVSYQSLNFAPINSCAPAGLPISAWREHTIYASTAGTVNVTIQADIPTLSCPVITNTQWINIGTISFRVLNGAVNPQLGINNIGNTTVILKAPENQTTRIPLGTLTGISTPSLYSSVNLTATPSACSPATNTYALTGTVSVTNNSQAGSLTLTAGTKSQTLAVGAGVSSVPYALTGLPATGANQLVTVTVPGCASKSVAYKAPNACSSIPAREAILVNEDLDVVVLANPLRSDVAEVLIRGQANLPLSLAIIDMQGRLISSKRVVMQQAEETYTLKVGKAVGVYLLKVASNQKSRSVRLVKLE